MGSLSAQIGLDMLDQAQLNRIQDPQTRHVVELLAKHLEQALTDNDTLRAENKRLLDEINRLKGEQGKPHNKPNKPKPSEPHHPNHSSEAARKEPKAWSKTTKNDKIVLDRTERVSLDRATLPRSEERRVGKECR